MRRPIRLTARTRRAAAAVTKPLQYWVLSGWIAAEVASGRLIRTGDFLARLDADDLPDGQKSWFGRHVATAYRAAHGCEPLRVWSQHRTTGRWIQVFVYGGVDAALYTGLQSYKGTRHVLATKYSEAA